MTRRNTIAVGGWGSRTMAIIGDTVAFTVQGVTNEGVIESIECGVGWDHTYREMLTVTAPSRGFSSPCLRSAKQHGVVAQNARLVSAARGEATT